MPINNYCRLCILYNSFKNKRISLCFYGFSTYYVNLLSQQKASASRGPSRDTDAETFDLNSPIQSFPKADFSLQSLVDEGEELLPILGQAALQGQVVGGVIAGKVERIHVQ